MKIILSPTKTMRVIEGSNTTTPIFIDKAKEIREYLKNQAKDNLKAIWKCNDKLIEENIANLNKYSLACNLTKAIYAYDGLQYKNINVDTLDSESLAYLNNSLRIISAMYGVLKPTDGIIPYRLEMQARVNMLGHSSMYSYWGDAIYRELTKNDSLIINLCSKEYSDAIEKYKKPNVKIVSISFYSMADGKPKVKGTPAKMLRGRIVRYMALNKVSNIDELKSFSELGYAYDASLSNENELIFVESLKN